MNAKGNSFYHKRSLTPKERADLENLMEENEKLKSLTADQDAALVELAELAAAQDDALVELAGMIG